MKFAPFLLVTLLWQDPVPAGPDWVFLATREVIAGEVLRYTPEGTIVVKSADRTREFAIEDVSRVFFESQPQITPQPGEQLRLAQGCLLTGKEARYAAGRFSIETPVGVFRAARAVVRTLALRPLDGAMPELKEEKGDVAIWKAAEDKELKAAFGELQEITGETIVLRDAKGEKVEVPRADVRLVYLRGESRPRTEPVSGWFARLQLKNGDKLVGILRGIDKEDVAVFSHLFGVLSVKKAMLHSVSFVQYPRLTVGNILVCEQNGVRELDRTGKELWRYQERISYPWAARKLENGNVLIANTNFNQVLEIRPKEGGGGEIEARIDGVNYPYDVHRLANGNTLLAEFYGNRVVEYDAKGAVVWQTPRFTYPMSVQRLENGNTLICTNSAVVEVDREGVEKWRAKVAGIRPWRAERLENGNTLIIDQARGQVLEVDPQCQQVWKKDGLSHPNTAIRLDDGNTLILEQGNGRIIEVDPAGRIVSAIGELNYPLHMSVY